MAGRSYLSEDWGLLGRSGVITTQNFEGGAMELDKGSEE